MKTIIVIKKEEFFFLRNKYWIMDPLDATTFTTVGEAQSYITKNLKDYKGCKVAQVEIEFKEKN